MDEANVRQNAHLWVIIGAILGFLGVAFGAFGAHGLSQRLSERSLAIFNTGAQYQMYHALALAALGAWANGRPEIFSTSGAWVTAAGVSFTAGTLIFSGSLYALAVTDIKILGAITPIGGLAFLVGWISFAIAALKA